MSLFIFIGAIVLGLSLVVTFEISSNKLNPNRFGKWWRKYICENRDDKFSI